MIETINPPQDVQVIDLVLDPFRYRDALLPYVTHGLLGSAAIDHLGHVLPSAIAQLDAIGDPYGALALSGLLEQLGPGVVTGT